MENPACTGLHVSDAPFLFIDIQRQFEASATMKPADTQIWVEKYTPILALTSPVTASATTFQLQLDSGESAQFLVHEQQLDQACGQSVIMMSPSEIIKQTDTAQWSQQTMPDSTEADTLIWTLSNSRILIVIEPPVSLADQVRPARNTPSGN